ncbi:5850_t:CDS:2 [Dentiscutata erythropus]|uniref:5850_t:CDS:1 n=1 Tax=Dentiscutata erythropus TaxID=1348616 RepID=A0A9N9ABW4_9GLOM|nr:5850_t:CDS:2 [Dentiscutata erythropus]
MGSKNSDFYNRKRNGLSLYIITYKNELEKKSLHNLREKVIILNATKAYRNETDDVRKYYDERAYAKTSIIA